MVLVEQDAVAEAAAPLARVLDRLAPVERETFLKAMDMLEAELRSKDSQR